MKGLLRGRAARVVVTMGMPALFYRVIFGAFGERSLERSVLRVRRHPTDTPYLGRECDGRCIG